MWKEKLGNYLIDISKYVFTGIVISSFLKILETINFLFMVLVLWHQYRHCYQD